MKLFSIATASVLLASATLSQSALEQDILESMEAAHIPGLSARVVRGGEVVWSGDFGFADVDQQRPASDETVWTWGSIGKSVTATAAMRMWDRGALELDADVDDFVTFQVQHPGAPAEPLTLHQLLTHTAGLADTGISEDLVVSGDWTLPLEVFLGQYLDPAGELYLGGQGYAPWAPGAAYAYSNVGYTLAAHAVEQASGQEFAHYCKERLFEPLGMHRTDWRLEEVDGAQLATGYVWDAGLGKHEALPGYSLPVWPAGMLRAPIRDMTRFVLAHLQEGVLDGTRILSSHAVRRMHHGQVEGDAGPYGYGFVVIDGAYQGRKLLWHDGEAPGLAAHMFLVPALDTAVLVACNASDDESLAWVTALEIAEALLAEAHTL